MAERRKPRIDVAAGALLDQDGSVLITRRPEGAELAGWWEFPGGKLEIGESPLQALTRELNEELGIVVRSVTPLVTYEHEYPERLVRLHAMLVTDYAGTPTGREGQPLQWVRISELMIRGLLPADEPIVAALQQIVSSNSTL